MMRKKFTALLAAVVAAGAMIVTAPAAHAGRPGNIFNDSGHGMWFTTSHVANAPLRWVPTGQWSRDVGVVAAGVFTGGGWCTKVYAPRTGGWREKMTFPGPRQINLDLATEWLVREYPC